MESKVFFTDIQKEIRKQLLTAKQGIKVAVAWFTDKNLFDTLIAKAKDGVIVDLLVANHEVNRNCEIDFYALEQYNCTFSFIGNDSNIEPFMHHKFCIIDNETVIYGSYNWTNKAASNFENITITKGDYRLIIDFISEFEKLKKFSNDTSNSSGSGSRTNKELLLKICAENNIEYRSEMEFIPKSFEYDEIVDVSEKYIIVRKSIGEEKINIVSEVVPSPHHPGFKVKKYEFTPNFNKYNYISWDKYGNGYNERLSDIDFDFGGREYIYDREVYNYEDVYDTPRYPKLTAPIWRYGVIDFCFNIVIPIEHEEIVFGKNETFLFVKYEWSKDCNKECIKYPEYYTLTCKKLVGILDANNNILLPNDYYSIGYFSNNNMVALKNDSIEFFNESYQCFSKVVCQDRIKDSMFNGNMLLVKEEKKRRRYNWVLDEQGQPAPFDIYSEQMHTFNIEECCYRRKMDLSHWIYGSNYPEIPFIVYELRELKNNYFLLSFEDYDNQIFFKK